MAWTYVGGPVKSLVMAQRLARILGPIGLSLLQQVMAAGAGAALHRIAELTREETERLKVKAATAAGEDFDAMAAALGAVKEVLAVELVGPVLEAMTGPDFAAWAADMLTDMRRDGVAVAPDDPSVSGGEFMVALWEVGRANAVFR